MGVVLAGGAYHFWFIAPYESADDAAIEGHVRPVAAQVSGRVERLLVQDNQEVKKGDMLLEIDPRGYEVKLSLAEASLTGAYARLGQAVAKFAVDQAGMERERAGISAAEAKAARSLAVLRRYQAVGNLGASQSQIDLASVEAADATAQAKLARDRERTAEAQADLSHTGIRTAFADIQGREAEARQAELNLSYTKITASDDGRVTSRTVEEGSYVQTGQPLMAIVPRPVWVIANVKETQLGRMRAGDPVAIRVEAHPRHIFTGRVESIQAGTSARLSIIPLKSVPGSDIKGARRVPVKILFDDAGLDQAGLPLGPGMSVETEVKVK